MMASQIPNLVLAAEGEETEPKSVLVTGGAGFIGSHLVSSLSERGHRVTVFDNISTGRVDGILRAKNAEFVRGDILEGDSLRQALRGVHAVVHLAALVSVSESVKDPSSTRRVNVEGTRSLLNEAVASGVRRFVFASTCAVYGDADSFPTGEVEPLRPKSPYAESKVEAEEVCGSFAGRLPGGLVILRFFNVYGPGQEISRYPNVVSSFIARMEAKEQPVVYGDGNQTRDFVHVSDVAESACHAVEKRGLSGTFNVGSGRETSLNELLTLLGRAFGNEHIEATHGPPREGDVGRSCADISKARRELGFSPRISLESGLRALAARGVP